MDYTINLKWLTNYNEGLFGLKWVKIKKKVKIVWWLNN